MFVSLDQLKQTFTELIAINSFYPDDLKVVEYVLDACKGAGVDAFQDDFGNVIAKLPGNSQPAVMLNTHVDIPEDTPLVDYEFSNGEFIGTGKTILGADPKTGLAVLIELMKYLSTQDHNGHSPVEFVFTRGEEQGLFGARGLDVSKLDSKVGLVIDEDGPANVLVTKAPGEIKFMGKFIGKVAHPRDPSHGINALQMAVNAIGQVPLGYTDDSQQASWNVGILSAGTASNSIPGEAAFLAELRSFNDEFLEQESARIFEIFKQSAIDLGGVLEATVEFPHKSYEISEDDPLLQRLILVQQQLGLKPELRHTFGASDASILNDRGIRCLPIGSGYYNAHQYTERASLTDMQTLAEFLLAFVKTPTSS